MHLRQPADDEPRSDREGVRLVRQRVGLLCRLVDLSGSCSRRRAQGRRRCPTDVGHGTLARRGCCGRSRRRTSRKRVLVRADLNVPLEDGRVADDTRIRAAVPTLEFLLDRGAARLPSAPHLGRPCGPDPAFAIAPVEARLRELVPDERLRVLENTRFLPGETTTTPARARARRRMDLYVNDAFGSAHRAHASTEGVARILPAHAGLLPAESSTWAACSATSSARSFSG